MQLSGRLSAILTSATPLTIIIPSLAHADALSAAVRLAHALNVYQKLDSEIVADTEALHRLNSGHLSLGNIVVISTSGAYGDFFRTVIGQGRSEFILRDRTFYLRRKPINGPGGAALFLHPHPSSAAGLVLVMYAVDQGGLEKAVRLFPIRTGVASPDWMLLSERTDTLGAGGVEGAG